MKSQMILSCAIVAGLAASAYAAVPTKDERHTDYISPYPTTVLVGRKVAPDDIQKAVARSEHFIPLERTEKEGEKSVSASASSTVPSEFPTVESRHIASFVKPISAHLLWDFLDSGIRSLSPAWLSDIYSLWKISPFKTSEEVEWNPFTWHARGMTGKAALFSLRCFEQFVLGAHPTFLGFRTLFQFLF